MNSSMPPTRTAESGNKQMTDSPAGKRECAEKWLMLAGSCLIIVLLLFKYVPDLGTALYQNQVSVLASFDAYRGQFLQPGSVFYPRFLGNYICYDLARIIESVFRSPDLRLHPLRIAAAILTPLYFLIGVSVPVFRGRLYQWRGFLAGYLLLFVGGMYVFYPYDAPSLAFLSLGLAFLLEGRLAAAWLCMLLTGLFRESAFHLVVFVGIWALVTQTLPVKLRLGWTLLFGLGFILEYKLVRVFFPGAVMASADGRLHWNLREALTGSGLLSLTTLVTLSLAALLPIAYLAAGPRPADPALRRFLLLNCLAFPLWIVFYRLMNGNISEFRLLWPVLLPCVYGMALTAPGETVPRAAAC